MHLKQARTPSVVWISNKTILQSLSKVTSKALSWNVRDLFDFELLEVIANVVSCALCDHKAGSFVLRLVVFICGMIDQLSNLNIGVRFRWLSSTDYGLATVRQLEDVTLLSP